MNENQHKSKETINESSKFKQNAKRRLARWRRMMKGDTQALIEIMIERGMAKKEDFIDRFSEA
ncbi:MAG: hypothetical protein ACH350_10640 [Parachlamydiaceae bacterium]